MKFLSICSGIEAASVAWKPLGWEAVGFSEIEPFPCAVLKHHYPDVPNHGDMTQFMEWPDATINVLCGGTPCQSFSVAGLRKGLDDPRGNLMLTFLAIAKRYRPQWVVWENVPGVLSSNGGRDFGSFLGGLAECGYGFAYRVLDAQYFGLAQRRKRVFVVGYLGDWHPAAAVLFESESLSGHPAPSREKRQRLAPTVNNGPPFSRTGNDRVETDAMVSMCLNAGAMGRLDAESETLLPVAATLDASDGRKWGSNQWINQGKAIIQPVTHSLRGEGFDTSEDGTGRGAPLVPVAMRESGQGYWMQDDIAGTLRAEGEDRPSRPSHVIGFHPTQDPISSTDVCHSIGANDNATAAVAVQASQSGVRINETIGTLDANYGSRRHNGVMQAMQVRRLTPVECERLQGFHDNYTAIPWRKKPASECPDGPRYKALGNSWAVPVVRWIGQRIMQVSEIVHTKQ